MGLSVNDDCLQRKQKLYNVTMRDAYIGFRCAKKHKEKLHSYAIKYRHSECTVLNHILERIDEIMELIYDGHKIKSPD